MDPAEHGDVKPLESWSVEDHLKFRTRKRSGQNPNPDLGRFPRVGDGDASPSDEELVAAGLRRPRRPEPEPYRGRVPAVGELINDSIPGKQRELRKVEQEISAERQLGGVGSPDQMRGRVGNPALRMRRLEQRRDRLEHEIEQLKQDEAEGRGMWSRAPDDD